MLPSVASKGFMFVSCRVLEIRGVFKVRLIRGRGHLCVFTDIGDELSFLFVDLLNMVCVGSNGGLERYNFLA